MTIPKGPRAELLKCTPDCSVLDAAKLMTEQSIGALCVFDDDLLVGLISERDVMTKAVVPGVAPAETKVRDVMKAPVTVQETMEIDDVLRKMLDEQVRHIPLVDADNKPLAMLTMRRLLDYRLDQMRDENTSLAAFIMADGIGG